jgi:AraC-like DNA-binding protein
MDYFGGITFGACDHVPACPASIDRAFPHYYALNYAHSGRIYWALDKSRPIILNAPVAWWTGKGNRPRYRYGRMGEETWDHYYVTFDGPRAARLIRQCLPSPESTRPYSFVADADGFRSRWERLFLSLGRGGPVRESWAVYEMEGMVLQLNQPLPSSVRSNLEVKLDVLRRSVLARPSAGWDWESEAARMGVSLVHLRRSFRKLTGLPPHQFLVRARMDIAARRLRTTTDSIKEVAAAVGLPDIYHFGKQFKACFHLPPATYRHEMHGLYSGV